MVKKPSKSILNLRCYKKLFLTVGIGLFLLTQTAIPLLADATLIINSNDDLQQVKISGQVIDEENIPMAGVYVIEKGTTNGVLTEANGGFSLTLTTANPVLVFSFVGYEPAEVVVGNQTTLTVTLHQATKGLGEIVVIGYGTARKEDVTGSVASIKGDAVRDVPAANITQALQGRISGVEMSQTSTKPGATMQIRVRGTRSLIADNDPLIVVDGIPFAGSISDISPNDIKSIDILKDASATAIYGSRGANGVILITSNKGSFGQKAKVTYNTYYALKKVFAPFPMMNGEDFVKVREAAGLYTNSLDESDDVNTDWQDLFYRDGMVANHDLSVTGGTDKSNYSFGMSYIQDKAVVPTQQYTRYSMRGSLDQQIGKLLRFGFSTNNNYSVTQGSQVGLYGVLSMSPIADPYNEDGSWKRTITMPLDEQFTWTREILDSLSNQYVSETKAYGSYNTVYGEIKIPGVEGLKYRANLGLNFRMSNGGSFTGEGIGSTTATTESTASISNSLTLNWAIENLLTYDRTFAEKHQVNAVVLYSAEQTHYNSSYISAKDIPNADFLYYNIGRAEGDITINPSYQGYSLSGLISYMGRVMYSYDNRYMFMASVRSDASSRLAVGHKWHTYPAFSAGWNISNESFMSSVTAIDQLKLRLGFGQTSNQAIDPYQTLGLLSTRPYNFGSVYSTGYYVSQLPNPDLGWEFSETWNVGIDFGILNNRLSGTLELYLQNTKNVLFDLSLPPTSGVSTITSNIGKTQNKGIELSLNGTILDNYNGWTWDVGFNIYANRNKIVELASGQEKDESNWWFVGHPIDVIYDYKHIGLWQEGDPYLDILEPGGNVGMIKVEYTGDYNEDGTPTRQIGSADRQILSMEAKFQGGFDTRLSYKGFDLGVVGAFKCGGILISTIYGSSGYLNILSGRRGQVDVDYWSEDNTDAMFPKPGGLGGDQPSHLNTLSYFDASYLKIRTISLGYNFDHSNWAKSVGMDKLRVYFTLQNAFVLFSPYHKLSGMDPEPNSYGNENAAVSNAYLERLLTLGTNTPSTRNYMVGLSVTF